LNFGLVLAFVACYPPRSCTGNSTNNCAPAFGVLQGPSAYRSGSSWLELPDHGFL